jgi:uncharacterized protein YndB with AHSA1/START domain
MRFLTLAAGVLLAQGAWAADHPYADVADTSAPQVDGSRLLQDAIIVGAPSERVWAAFVDPQTISGWSAPMAMVDLRQGGFIEEGFTKAAKPGSPDNIRHRILAYLPGRLLILRNENAPRGLPGGARFKDVVQIVEIETLDPAHTRVRLSQTGYGHDAEFDKLYGFFETHNPEFLEELKTALEKPNGAEVASGAAPIAR